MSKTNVGVGVHTTSTSTTKMGVATALLGVAAIAAAAAGGLAGGQCTASTVTAISGGEVAVCRGETLIASSESGESVAIQIKRYSNATLALSLQASSGGQKTATLNKETPYSVSSASGIDSVGTMTYIGISDQSKAVLLFQIPTLPPPSPPTEEVPLASCSDSIQNQDETGLDCGGSCQACAEETILSLPADLVPPTDCVFIKGSIEQIEQQESGGTCTFKKCTGTIPDSVPNSKWTQIKGKISDNFSSYCLKVTCQGVGVPETFQCKVIPPDLET